MHLCVCRSRGLCAHMSARVNDTCTCVCRTYIGNGFSGVIFLFFFFIETGYLKFLELAKYSRLASQ